MSSMKNGGEEFVVVKAHFSHSYYKKCVNVLQLSTLTAVIYLNSGNLGK